MDGKARKGVAMVFLIFLSSHAELAGQPDGGKGGGPPDTVPVVIAFRDQTGDAIKSDGGIYVDGCNGVRAQLLLVSGNVVLDTAGIFTKGKPIEHPRKIFFKFIDGSDVTESPPFTEGTAGGFMSTTECETGLPVLSSNEATRCELNFRFTYPEDSAGSVWFARFNPNVPNQPINLSTKVDVRCDAVDDENKCRFWTISRSETDQAHLAKQNPNADIKKRLDPIITGIYQLPTQITIAIRADRFLCPSEPSGSE